MRNESKIILFILFSIVLISCGANTEKEYYNKAKASIQAKKYDDAYTYFDKLVKEFPESEKYCEAMFEIGKLFHGKVVGNLPPEVSLQKAVEYYSKTFEKCSETSMAQDALFMVGFINANDLNNLDEARKAYNQFLTTYPKSELASSAKLELENLGVPAEEFLKQKNKTEN